MNRLIVLAFVIAIAAASGFAVARATSGMEARMAASGAAIAAGEGCSAVAKDQWPIGGASSLTLEARTFGPTCANATAVLVVSNGEGLPLYQSAHAARHVLGLAEAQTPQAMGEALAAWIAPGPAQTSQSLPPWPPGSEAPTGGEFAFYPSQSVAPDFYEGLRAENAPLWCFTQGMESARCLLARNGGIEDIGVQLFPG